MRKYFTYIAVILFLLSGLAGCKKDDTTGVATGSISGKYSPARAAAGAVAVAVSGTGSINAKLDTSNGFSITGLQPGSYKIGFTASPGFTAPDSVLATVIAGKNADLGTVVFTQAPIDFPQASISGTISPAGAVTSVMVTWYGQDNILYTAVPDASTGVFKISNVASGDYTVRFANASGYEWHHYVNISVEPGQNADMGNISFEQGTVITGTISPVGSVNDISISNTQSGAGSPVNFDGASGNFSTVALPPGEYFISYNLVPGYKFSATGTMVTVTSGPAINLGTIVMLPDMLSGLPFTGAVTQSYSQPNLSIYSTYKDNDQVGGRQSFTISMDNINGPGTYPCLGTASSNITYTISATGGPFGLPDRSWSTINTGGTGTIVVTSIDPVKKEIKGTFTATLVSSTPGEADVIINNGSFYFGY